MIREQNKATNGRKMQHILFQTLKENNKKNGQGKN